MNIIFSTADKSTILVQNDPKFSFLKILLYVFFFEGTIRVYKNNYLFIEQLLQVDESLPVKLIWYVVRTKKAQGKTISKE